MYTYDKVKDDNDDEDERDKGRDEMARAYGRWAKAVSEHQRSANRLGGILSPKIYAY